MPVKSNSELVAAYLDAVIRKDASAVDRFFAPDVEYFVNGTRVPDPAGMLPPISPTVAAGGDVRLVSAPRVVDKPNCLYRLRNQS